MIAQRETSGTPLSEYEAGQVERIAAWKSEHPNSFAEVFKQITRPGTRLVERLLPDRVVVSMIEKTLSTSALMAGQESVKRKAGVQTLDELFQRSLEECDRLALDVARGADSLAAVEGALTGGGGVLTTLIDIPLLFALAMRTIVKIGHCYGYPLDHRQDQRLVLAILLVATSGSLERKQVTLVKLRRVEDLLLEETQEELIAEEALSLLFQLEVFDWIPGVGILSGAALNYGFMRKVVQAAQFVFEESWLRQNGKIEMIEPAEQPHPVRSHGRIAGALARAAYSACYGVGFTVAAPAYLIAAAFAGSNNALGRGVRDGAAAAAADLDRMLSGGKAESGPLAIAGS